MTNRRILQTHKAYTSLVCDLVYALREGDWDKEAEVIQGLATIPSDVPDLEIQFAVTKVGSITMSATGEGSVLATWLLLPTVTGIEDKPTAIMQIGRLQAALETFWDTLQSKCMRVDMQHRRSGPAAGVMSSRTFFSDRMLRLWLGDHVGMIFTVRPGEIKVGTDRYHLNRSWRRDIRGMLAQGV